MGVKNKKIEARVNRTFEQAKLLGVDPGWLWLFKNGFPHRVPADIRAEIEEKITIKGGENNA